MSLAGTCEGSGVDLAEDIDTSEDLAAASHSPCSSQSVPDTDRLSPKEEQVQPRPQPQPQPQPPAPTMTTPPPVGQPRAGQKVPTRKATYIGLAFITVATLFVKFGMSDVPAEVAATTPLGPVQGYRMGGAVEYLGLPYANPAKRWARATLKKPWGNVLHGYTREQPPVGCVDADGKGQEDCLWLNVYTPSHATDRSKLPVMVWLHGGCFSRGSPMDYDGGQLAQDHDVVVVVPAYRLGVFAGLYAPSEGADGLLSIDDQRLALRWVQMNIAAFGGDPRRVTLAGQSSGASAVAVHYTAPASRGLFSRAAVLSGGFVPWDTQPAAAAESTAKTLLHAVNCSTLSCLRQLPARTIATAVKQAQCADGCIWAPPAGGAARDLPLPPYEALHAADTLALEEDAVPLLLGSCRHDGFEYGLGARETTAANFSQWLERRWPAGRSRVPRPEGFAGTVGGLFPQGADGPAESEACDTGCRRAVDMETKLQYDCPLSAAGEAVAAWNTTVFRMVFAHEGSGTDRTVAAHSCMLPYLWNYAPGTRGWKGRTQNLKEDALVRTVQTAWVRFMSGDAPGDHWLAVRPGDVSVHVLREEQWQREAQGPAVQEQCKFFQNTPYVRSCIER